MANANMTFDEKVRWVCSKDVRDYIKLSGIGDSHALCLARDQAVRIKKAHSKAMTTLNARFSGSITYDVFAVVIDKLADTVADNTMTVFACATVLDDNTFIHYLGKPAAGRIGEIVESVLADKDGKGNTEYLDELESVLANGSSEPKPKWVEPESRPLMKHVLNINEDIIEKLLNLEEVLAKETSAARWEFIRAASDELEYLVENVDKYFAA